MGLKTLYVFFKKSTKQADFNQTKKFDAGRHHSYSVLDILIGSPFFLYFFKKLGSYIMIRTFRNMQKVQHGHISKFHMLIYLRSRDICKEPRAIQSNILDIVGLVTIQSVGSQKWLKVQKWASNSKWILRYSQKHFFYRWWTMHYWLCFAILHRRSSFFSFFC